MKNYFYSKVFLLFGLMLTIAGGISFNPTQANAAPLCPGILPLVGITIPGYGTYTNSASKPESVYSITVPSDTVISATYQNSSSWIRNIQDSWPYSGQFFSGPVSGYQSNRTHTTSPITTSGSFALTTEAYCSASDEGSEGAFGSVRINVSVAVPVVTLSTSPTSGNAPLSTTLNWSATGSPTGCTASASPSNSNWSGAKATPGSQTISGLAAGTHTFNLFCTNGGGNSTTKTATVTVSAPSSFNVTATANPAAGGNVTASQSVSLNNRANIAANANTDYVIDLPVVQGNCIPSDTNPPYGYSTSNTSSNSYTTGPVRAPCNVIINFKLATPSTPSNLTATPSSCGSGTINVAWGSVSGATSYQLRDGTTQIYSGPGFLHSHTGLTAGSSHSYTVRATNSAGSSAWSSVVSATAPAVCPPTTLPDLTAGTSNATATKNVAQNFSASIRNNGTASVPSGTIKHIFQFDENSNHDIINYSGTSNSTGSISSGGVRNISHSYTFSTTGTKYYRVCADADSRGPSTTGSTGIITESVESNNCGAWVTITVTDAAVPVVTLTANPTSMTLPTSSTTLTWSATNSPTGCTASANPANSSWSGAKAVSGPQVISGLTAGTHTFSLFCTNGGGNSSTVNAPVTVSAAPFIDLTASAPTPTTATIGTARIFTSTITNGGNIKTGTANFTNLFQTSPSSTGASEVTNYAVSGMTPLAAGASANASVPITFPTGTPSTMYIRACADKSSAANTGTITESNENNNCSMSTPWTAVTVTPPPAPDLTASAPTQNTAVIGTAQTFTSTITNGGNASTGSAFFNSLQVATGAGGTGAVSPLIASTPSPMPILAAGASNTTFSASYTFTGSAGTRSVRVCADNNTSMAGSINEGTNEGNNCSAWVNVIVSAAGAMSGTLTPSATSCIIALNNSSCNINMGWSITNPEATPTAITATGMTNINVSNSLTPSFQSGTQSVTVPYSTRTFYLYNNSKSLVPTSPSGSGVVITSSCASGTLWNNGQCRAGVNGQCATPPNGYTYSSAPSGTLCTAGTAVPSSLSGDGPWSWVCNGSGVGTSASCSASAEDDDGGGGEEECSNGATNYPECTTDDGGGCINGATNPPICDVGVGTLGVCSTPDNHTNPCYVGTPSAITSGTSAWTWTCAASAGTASCSEAKKKPIFIED